MVRRAISAAFALLAAAVLAVGCSGMAPGPEEIAREDVQARTAQLLRIADATREGGDLQSAQRLYRQAHGLSPEEPAPLTRLGETALALGTSDEAARAYAKAVERAPEDAGIRLGFGRALLADGRPAEAAGQFRAALALDAKRLAAYRGLGAALDRQGDHEAARTAYYDGLGHAPDDAGLLNNLAFSWLLAGETEQAIDLLAGPADDLNATPRTRQNLALAYGLAGETEKAAAMARRDFTEAQAANNLAFYARLRAMTPEARKAALLDLATPDDPKATR